MKLGPAQAGERAGSFPGTAEALRDAQPRFPGSVPDIWSVPHLRNPNFTEPGQRLADMHDALCSGRPAALTQALAGFGGVGKTQLAVEYAYRHMADYAIVWWVRAEQAVTLAADYAALAAALDLPEKNAAEQPVIIAAVRDALAASTPTGCSSSTTPTRRKEIRAYLPGAGWTRADHIAVMPLGAAWPKPCR